MCSSDLDRKVGTIRCMTPVKPDGSTDSARSVLFLGEAQIMTPMGALPVSFEIEAATLAEAIEKYGESAKEGIERTVKEIQEMRRQAASSIKLSDQRSQEMIRIIALHHLHFLLFHTFLMRVLKSMRF